MPDNSIGNVKSMIAIAAKILTAYAVILPKASIAAWLYLSISLLRLSPDSCIDSTPHGNSTSSLPYMPPMGPLPCPSPEGIFSPDKSTPIIFKYGYGSTCIPRA